MTFVSLQSSLNCLGLFVIMIGLTRSLHPSIFHHNYKISLIANYWHSLEGGFCCVTITLLCVLSPGLFRQPFRIVRQWFMLAGVLGKTRVVLSYTISIV